METLTHRLVPKLRLVMYIGLHTDDRFDSLFFHCIVKVDGSKHIAMICHGNRGHTEFFDFLRQCFDLVGTVKE